MFKKWFRGKYKCQLATRTKHRLLRFPWRREQHHLANPESRQGPIRRGREREERARALPRS